MNIERERRHSEIKKKKKWVLSLKSEEEQE